jgi:AhpC/TSA family
MERVGVNGRSNTTHSRATSRKITTSRFPPRSWPRMIWGGFSLEIAAVLHNGETMKRVLATCLLLTLTPGLAPAPAQTQKPEVAKISLKVGDPAPDFSLLSDQWKPVKLSDYRGKKNVFLAIYILAFTGG